MQLTSIRPALASGLLLLLIQRAQAQQHVTLPGVTIQGQRPQRLSTYHGEYVRGVRPLTPGERCVVWLPSPDSTARYQLQSLTVPLHQRYTAGRLHISFYAAGRGGALLGEALPAAPLIISPPDSVAKRRTQVRLDLRAAALQLPPTGIFVVLDGLTTYADEVYVRRILIQRGKTRKDGSAIARPFIVTRRGADTTAIWTPDDRFPKLRQSPAGYVAYTWLRVAPQLPYRRESVQGFRGRTYPACDTVVELEVSKL